MSDTRRRILLLGDYSNCHRTLATGLRRLGCDVTVASDGTRWQKGERDIDISRSDGKVGGMWLWMKANTTLRRHLEGYDIVAINDPNFLRLRPKRLRPIFDRLRGENGSVFLTAMSTDIPFLDMLARPNSPIRYSEWFVDGRPSRMQQDDPSLWNQWHKRELIDYQEHVYANIDGAVAVLYEYMCGISSVLPPEKCAYAGIPVDTSLLPVELPAHIDKVHFFLGRDRMRKLQKGSDLLEDAARAVIARHPDKARLTIVENRPYAEFCSLLRQAHVVLDQIYSYTPATTALLAMACGIPTVSGAEADYYDFLGENKNRPVINAPLHTDAIADTLERLVTERDSLAEIGRMSREFAVKHNDCEVVAQRFLDFWNSRLC